MAKYSKATVIPAAPAVSATDGTYEDRVVITWKAVLNATSYEVWRNTSPDKLASGVNFKKLGDTADCVFEDKHCRGRDGLLLFRQGEEFILRRPSRWSVKTGISKYSAGNSGFVSNTPKAPASVAASDGTYFDKIRVS